MEAVEVAIGRPDGEKGIVLPQHQSCSACFHATRGASKFASPRTRHGIRPPQAQSAAGRFSRPSRHQHGVRPQFPQAPPMPACRSRKMSSRTDGEPVFPALRCVASRKGTSHATARRNRRPAARGRAPAHRAPSGRGAVPASFLNKGALYWFGCFSTKSSDAAWIPPTLEAEWSA
jgi:hypothetical protein